jgi:hypothetical protein
VPVARLATLVLALLACAWLVLGIRQTDDVQQASAIVSSSAALSAAQARHAASLLDDARTLNPDAEVDVLRARVALGRGDLARARQILGGVVSAEPMNLDGWSWMVRASKGDPHDLLIAFSRVLQLVPRVPPPR